MATHPRTRLPDNTKPASPEYPYGQAQSITLPGDGTGTPWDESHINDLWGWKQALLTASGITPTGLPETALASQYLQAMITLTGAILPNVASMQAATHIFVGARISTQGYYEIGDGGGAEYIIVAAGTGTHDGGRYIDLAGISAQAKLVSSKVNVKMFGAKGDGTNDDTQPLINALNSFPVIGQSTDPTPLTYYRGVLEIPAGKYRITDQVVIPLGVSVIGDPQATNYNIPGLVDDGMGSVFWVENTTNLPAFVVVGATLRGTAASIENIKFSHGQTMRLAGPYAGTCFDLQGAFMYNMRNCGFFELGFSTALGCSVNSNGVRVDGCNFIKIGDPNSQQTMPPASGYTAGDGIDFRQCYDSFVTNTFIEACGGTGLQVSTNTKVIGCFVDLNKRGIHSHGEHNQILGTSVKWNQVDGVQLTNSDGIVISGCNITGNNYRSATTGADIGYAIRFDTTSTKHFTITGNNLVDDFESNPVHSQYKTVRQAAINLGLSSDTKGVITGNVFSDPDAGWDSAVQNQYPVADVTSREVAGFVTISSNHIESAGPANLVHAPFTTAAGTTLGTVIKRIAYKDSDGNVIGQIPLYDAIT